MTVTALCPGPTITEFQKAAGLEAARLFHGPFLMRAPEAAPGYEGMMRGKPVVIPGAGNFLLAQSVRFSPRRLVTAVARRIQDKRK